MLIIHTSDMHGKLSPEKVKKLLNFKKRGAILLDSGDALSAGNLDIRWRERTLRLMSLAGYTAGAVGNREFHPIKSLLRWKLRDANFHHLSANLIPNNFNSILPFLKIEIDGYRIAIIGLTLPQVRGFWRRFPFLQFSEPIPCAIKLTEELREDVDFFIFLTHLGIARDIMLAKEIERESLILGGHNHILLREPIVINNSYIFHSGCYAKHCWLIEFERGRIKGWIEKL
ncbi:metallophosphoesterase [bacterium]|nr:metallophosphoesterase [bacterium]